MMQVEVREFSVLAQNFSLFFFFSLSRAPREREREEEGELLTKSI